MGLNKSEHSPKRKSQSWRMLPVALGLLIGLHLPAVETKTIIFFGDSLTAGYGVDPDEAYPALIQKRIDAQGLPWRVVNAGLSGETTAGGLRRLDWILRQPVDIFLIELGGNDGLRGVDTATTEANLEAMIARIRQRDPTVKVIIAGMQMPTNMGSDYTKRFAAIYPSLARKTGAILLPFLLDGVGGVPNLNQADGIHPTPQGHAVVADTVWQLLQPLL